MGWGGYSRNGGHDDGTNRRQKLLRAHKGVKPKKTVFSTDMVIHVWAQQSQTYGTNGKASVFFDGPTLFSYGEHFVMARFARPNVVLFNAARHSHTTTGHQYAAWRAVAQHTHFEVQNPCAATDIEHDENLAWFRQQAEAAVAIVKNPRPGYRQRTAAVAVARRHAETAAKYQKVFFPRRRKAPITLPDLREYEHAAAISDKRAEFVRLLNAFCDEEHRRSKQTYARRILKTANELRALGTAFPRPINPLSLLKTYCAAHVSLARTPPTEWIYGAFAYTRHAVTTAVAGDDYRAVKTYPEGSYAPQSFMALESFIAHQKTTLELEARDVRAAQWRREAAEHAARQEKEWAERRRLANASDAERRAAWRDGRLRTFDGQTSECMLRIADNNRIQTSWGAEFPIEHARRAWPLIRAVFASGRPWQTNGHKIPLGHFQVDSIAADGTLRAGCHTLTRAEIEHCAALLGLLVDNVAESTQ